MEAGDAPAWLTEPSGEVPPAPFPGTGRRPQGRVTRGLSSVTDVPASALLVARPATLPGSPSCLVRQVNHQEGGLGVTAVHVTCTVSWIRNNECRSRRKNGLCQRSRTSASGPPSGLCPWTGARAGPAEPALPGLAAAPPDGGTGHGRPWSQAPVRSAWLPCLSVCLSLFCLLRFAFQGCCPQSCRF